MDVLELAKKVVDSLKGDKSLLTSFAGDPTKIVTQILGGNISADIITKVIDEVKSQLGSLLPTDAVEGALDAAKDVAEKAAKDSKGGILGAIKNLF